MHILTGSKANDSDLAWILNLRINKEGQVSIKGSQKLTSTITSPPETFFKQTIASNKQKQPLDTFDYGGNHNDVLFWFKLINVDCTPYKA